MLQSDAINDSVYLVETVPPPPGESDVYSAATRIRPTPLADMAALLDGGETAEQDPEVDVHPVLHRGDPVRDASTDHGAPRDPRHGEFEG